jgi:hypothetical protein
MGWETETEANLEFDKELKQHYLLCRTWNHHDCTTYQCVDEPSQLLKESKEYLSDDEALVLRDVPEHKRTTKLEQYRNRKLSGERFSGVVTSAELANEMIEAIRKHYKRGSRGSVYGLKQHLSSKLGYCYDWELALWMLEAGVPITYDGKRTYCSLNIRSRSTGIEQKPNRYRFDMPTEDEAKQAFDRAWKNRRKK